MFAQVCISSIFIPSIKHDAMDMGKPVGRVTMQGNVDIVSQKHRMGASQRGIGQKASTREAKPMEAAQESKEATEAAKQGKPKKLHPNKQNKKGGRWRPILF